MPMIEVHILEGRSDEQKRQLIERLTDVMVDVCGSKRERVGVTINEVPADNWGRGGVPMSDAAGAASAAISSPSPT